MALTAARKKANAKYEAKAYDKTLIRLPKGRLDEIRAHIEPTGESLNGFIGRAIQETMERDGSEGLLGAPGAILAAGVSLPSETVKAAQKAAEAAGEGVPQFIGRAVETQAERDALARRMGGGNK